MENLNNLNNLNVDVINEIKTYLKTQIFCSKCKSIDLKPLSLPDNPILNINNLLLISCNVCKFSFYAFSNDHVPPKKEILPELKEIIPLTTEPVTTPKTYSSDLIEWQHIRNLKDNNLFLHLQNKFLFIRTAKDAEHNTRQTNVYYVAKLSCMYNKTINKTYKQTASAFPEKSEPDTNNFHAYKFLAYAKFYYDNFVIIGGGLTIFETLEVNAFKSINLF